jgi:hypothetical protein
LLGQGPLSKGRIGEPNAPLALAYERIDRMGAPTAMTLILGPGVATGGSVRIALSRDFMDRISVEEAIPEPAKVETGAQEVVYTFEVEDPTRSTAVRLDFDYEQAGLTRGKVRMEGGPQLEFEVFVWP